MSDYSSTKPSYINTEESIDTVYDVLKEIENQKQEDKEKNKQELISNYKENKHRITSDGYIEVFRHGTSKTHDLAKELFIPKGWEVCLQEDIIDNDESCNWEDTDEKKLGYWCNSRIIIKIPSLKNKIISSYNNFIKENGLASFYRNTQIIVYEYELNKDAGNIKKNGKGKRIPRSN